MPRQLLVFTIALAIIAFLGLKSCSGKHISHEKEEPHLPHEFYDDGDQETIEYYDDDYYLNSDEEIEPGVMEGTPEAEEAEKMLPPDDEF